MSRKIIVAALTTLTLIGSAGVASAETRGWGWGGWGSGERREARQEAAIEQGRRNGTLTGSEYRSLKAEQDRIDGLQNRARADGYVSPRERQQIREAQDRAGRHIYQETHDADGRGSGRGGWYRRWW